MTTSGYYDNNLTNSIKPVMFLTEKINATNKLNLSRIQEIISDSNNQERAPFKLDDLIILNKTNAKDALSNYIHQLMLIYAYKKINSFKSLKQNWNDNGADPIDDAVINNAINVIKKISFMKKYPEIYPTARNSIQFEFDFNGIYFELEVFTDKIQYLIDNNNTMADGLTDLESINTLIEGINDSL